MTYHLDRIAAEQAAWYGVSVEQLEKTMSDAAAWQELDEETQELFEAENCVSRVVRKVFIDSFGDISNEDALYREAIRQKVCPESVLEHARRCISACISAKKSSSRPQDIYLGDFI